MTADPYHAQLLRTAETASLHTAPAAQAVRRYLVADGNGVSWSELLREIGGIRELAALLDDEGEPDPGRINPLVDRIYARTAARSLAGGIRMTTYPTHPEQPEPREP